MTTLRIAPDLALPDVVPLDYPVSRGRTMYLSTEVVDWALQRIAAKTEVAGECWIFSGYTKNGYGVISIRNRPVYVHRFVCTLAHGPIPQRHDVCHQCDRRRCWRPDHLSAGTRLVNVADCWRKGRASPPPRIRGERHHKSTLSDEDVAHIRETWARGGVDQRTLAAAYGVSQSTIWRYVHREVRAS